VGKIPPGVGPRFPQVVVLVGATGDLARRKLLPGLFHLASTGFIPGCRIVGVSLDDLDADGFRTFARKALDEFSTREVTEADWNSFCDTLDYVPLAAGAAALKIAVEKAEQALAGESRRLHYLSVPPSAALPAVRLLGEAKLVERSRIIMEKPFGTDLYRHACWKRRRRCASTLRAHGARMPSINSSLPGPGGCPSSESGAIPTAWAADARQ
jgi:glucose-6-phosphate 1-dehydrogenase